MKTKIQVWTVASCLPDEGKPACVAVFGSLAEARAHFDQEMRSEWECNAPKDEEGEALPYPDDADVAHEMMDVSRARIEEDGLSEKWGRYSLDSHIIEVELP